MSASPKDFTAVMAENKKLAERNRCLQEENTRLAAELAKFKKTQKTKTSGAVEDAG